MALEFKSPSFDRDGLIPSVFTCEGKDVSPALVWSNAPAGTKSFAIICDDPDAPMGTWVHWVIYNIPLQANGLPQGMAKDPALKDGSRQGMTNFGRTGYGGPCPPPGKPHRYYFKLYALDSMLDIEAQATKEALLEAMKGHILAEARIMGTYKR